MIGAFTSDWALRPLPRSASAGQMARSKQFRTLPRTNLWSYVSRQGSSGSKSSRRDHPLGLGLQTNPRKRFLKHPPAATDETHALFVIFSTWRAQNRYGMRAATNWKGKIPHHDLVISLDSSITQ